MTREPTITYQIMSSIKQKDTEPELLLRKELWKLGLRYRVNYHSLIGKPDIVFTKKRVVVFCDGDFWHGHNWAVRGLESLEAELSMYSEFWRKKILRNIERDREVSACLVAQGWRVLRIWESEIRKNPQACARLVKEFIVPC